MTETPVFIGSEGAELFGILTSPPGDSNGIAVLALWGGVHPVFGRNQMRARLARHLAAQGFHVLRVDLAGVGDSTGDFTFRRLDQPALDDVTAAARWLESHGLSRIVLVGTCFGGRSALAAASGIPGLNGLALLACPVREEGHGEVKASRQSISTLVRRGLSVSSLRLLKDREGQGRALLFLRKVMRRIAAEKLHRRGTQQSDWASPLFVRPLEQVVARGLPVLLAYGKGDDFYPDFERARSGRLGRAIEEGGDRVTVRVVEERLHGFISIGVQDEAIAMVTAWLGELPALRQPWLEPANHGNAC